MSLKIKVKKEIDFQPIPEGTYPAICYCIADLGMQYNEKFKKLSQKILFIWEIVDDEQRIEIDGEMKRRAISRQYTASFAPKSSMYKDIRPWIGREFTPEEQEGFFDVGQLLGKPCLLNVIHTTTAEGKTYANVSGIMPLPKSMNVGDPENSKVLYDIDESSDNIFDMLPEWVREIIAKSKNADITNANSVPIKIDEETGEIIGNIDDIIED